MKKSFVFQIYFENKRNESQTKLVFDYLFEVSKHIAK